jgi:hypothetical protein
MKKSKYLNQTFGAWTCTHVGVAVKTRVFKKGTKIRNEYPHHQTYYYVFERQTSDGKADKMIRLNASTAAKVYRGELDVETIADSRQETKQNSFSRKVSYHFYNN